MTMEKRAAAEQVDGRSSKRRSRWFTRKVMLPLAGATLLGGAILVAPQFQSEASAAPPACNAPEGSDCLSISNKTKDVHSIRSLDNNGQCVTNVLPGKRTDVEQVFVPEGAPTINAFTSNDCGGDRAGFMVTDLKTKNGYTVMTIKDLPPG